MKKALFAVLTVFSMALVNTSAFAGHGCPGDGCGDGCDCGDCGDCGGCGHG